MGPSESTPSWRMPHYKRDENGCAWLSYKALVRIQWHDKGELKNIKDNINIGYYCPIWHIKHFYFILFFITKDSHAWIVLYIVCCVFFSFFITSDECNYLRTDYKTVVKWQKNRCLVLFVFVQYDPESKEEKITSANTAIFFHMW